MVKSHAFQFGPCLLFMWMLNCPPAFKLYFKPPRLIYKNLLIKHCKLISEHLHFLTFLFTKVVTYLLLNRYSKLVKINLITLNDKIKIKGFVNYSKNIAQMTSTGWRVSILKVAWYDLGSNPSPPHPKSAG